VLEERGNGEVLKEDRGKKEVIQRVLQAETCTPSRL